jgi:hypothetical protein
MCAMRTTWTDGTKLPTRNGETAAAIDPIDAGARLRCVGAWRSLVAHQSGGLVVVGSNPAAPTNFQVSGLAPKRVTVPNAGTNP